MNHDESFICVSIVTIISFFNLIVEMGNQSVKKITLSPEFHEPAVRNEYKPSFYKLWQCITKNKPFPHNDRAFHSNNKKYHPIQRFSSLYPYSLKKFRQSEFYTKQLTSLAILKWLSFESGFPFCRHNDYNVGCGFTPYVCSVSRILSYIRSQIYDYKKYSALSDFILRIYRDTGKQKPKELRKLNAFVSKIFHYRMCRL